MLPTSTGGNIAELANQPDSRENSVAENPSTKTKSIVSTQSGLIGRADTPEIDNSAAKSENKIELLIPEKSFRRERGTDAVRISYDDIDLLKILNMEPVPPNAAEYWSCRPPANPQSIRSILYAREATV